MLFCGTSDSERVCRVTSTSYQCQPAPHMLIQCEEIAFDGENFAWKPLAFKIPPFAGNLPVTELESYPLLFHCDPEGVKERLIARAKKTLKYQELTYCEYTGTGIRPGQCGMEKHNVSLLLFSVEWCAHKTRFRDASWLIISATPSTMKVSPETKVEANADEGTLVGMMSSRNPTLPHFQKRSKRRIRKRCWDLAKTTLSLCRLS